MSCSEASLAAGAPLAATATVAERWLLVELDGAWRRDVAEHELPEFEGRTMLIRRPDRRGAEPALFVAEATEAGGSLRRVASLDDLDGGERLPGPVLLVCCHGRRDPCCARLGTPVFETLRDRDNVWQSSHHGGHRFAANVLALPAGIQLGRVTPDEAPAAAAALSEGRIPLEHYRGRALYPPHVQAAEVAVRRAHALDHVGDLRLVGDDSATVRFAAAGGVLAAFVEESPGPVIPASCGAVAEPTTSFRVRLS